MEIRLDQGDGISLVGDATAGGTEPKPLGSIYAPFGRLISCETVITVDSASIQTPIVGLVIEDVYHAGRLVIPATGLQIDDNLVRSLRDAGQR